MWAGLQHVNHTRLVRQRIRWTMLTIFQTMHMSSINGLEDERIKGACFQIRMNDSFVWEIFQISSVQNTWIILSFRFYRQCLRKFAENSLVSYPLVEEDELGTAEEKGCIGQISLSSNSLFQKWRKNVLIALFVVITALSLQN